MELSPYVEGLRRELASLTRFAPDEVVRLAEHLAEALDSPVRLTLLDVLSNAAAEITERLEATVIDVRLARGEPEFVVTAVHAHHQPPPESAARATTQAAQADADDGTTARVTLRLSEALKARIEAQASAAGVSVNSWLAHAAIRALDDPPGRQRATSSPLGQRITGYARG